MSDNLMGAIARMNAAIRRLSESASANGVSCVMPQITEARQAGLEVAQRFNEQQFPDAKQERKHSHYYKDVIHLETIDVYRVLKLFNVTDPCLQHAVKKLLVAGGRGAGKGINRDVQEAIDTLKRFQEMDDEDCPL